MTRFTIFEQVGSCDNMIQFNSADETTLKKWLHFAVVALHLRQLPCLTGCKLGLFAPAKAVTGSVFVPVTEVTMADCLCGIIERISCLKKLRLFRTCLVEPRLLVAKLVSDADY